MGGQATDTLVYSAPAEPTTGYDCGPAVTPGSATKRGGGHWPWAILRGMATGDYARSRAPAFEPKKMLTLI